MAKLSWLVAWYIRDETYQKGLAELVNYQHGLPFAAYWGEVVRDNWKVRFCDNYDGR